MPASECVSEVITRWVSLAIGEISDRSWQDGDNDVDNDKREVYDNVNDLEVVIRL